MSKRFSLPIAAIAGLMVVWFASASYVPGAKSQVTGTEVEPVGMPAAEEANTQTAKPKKEIDTRLLVNIAGGIAVGLLVIAGIGVTMVARRARE